MSSKLHDAEPTTTDTAESGTSTQQPRRFLLLTHPRTASNLFLRILNLDAQSNLIPGIKKDYHFRDKVFVHHVQLGERWLDTWSQSEQAMMAKVEQQCFDSLDSCVRESQAQSKDIYIKEHAVWLNDPVTDSLWARSVHNTSTNPSDNPQPDTPSEPHWMINAPGYTQTRSPQNLTVLPDEYLLTWRPTFLIRHPALVFPSLYRTVVDIEGAEAAKSQPSFAIEMTLHWLRILYDFYKTHSTSSIEKTPWPIIIDADDIITSPQVIGKYCTLHNFDVAKLKYTWPSARQEETSKLHEVVQRMMSTIFASTGIVEGKTAEGIDLEVEIEKWKTEFGVEEASKLEGWVKGAMEDYEYLRERRLKV